jgi:hypothetical protein
MVFGIVGLLGFFLRIQVVEVPIELVETVNRRQKLIAVAKVIFADLSCHVALRLQEFGQGRVAWLQSLRGTW